MVPLLAGLGKALPWIGKGFGSLFGSKAMRGFGKRLDPTMLTLGALSLLGGGADTMKSFEGAGLADPRQALQQALAATYRMGQGMSERGPVRLRTTVAPPPKPVQIEGLPFQIGGGLGTDPAIADPSLLEGRALPTQYDPFQSLEQAGVPQQRTGSQQRGARRREPGR